MTPLSTMSELANIGGIMQVCWLRLHTHHTQSPPIPVGELIMVYQNLVVFFLAANGKITYVSAASFSTSNFVGSANSYGNQMQEQTLESSSVTAQCPTQTLPSRPKTQRPRVPPPSKVSINHIT
jgi:hypothetical protein